MVRTGLLLLACSVLLAEPLRAAEPDDRDLTARLAAFWSVSFAYQGSRSCSAVACHGGPQPGVVDTGLVRGMEFQVWLSGDPHVHAARTLQSPRSLRMMRLLGIMQQDRIVDPVGYENCLRCHATPRGPNQLESQFTLADGVSCEACHGPSSQWLSKHYRRDWNAESRRRDGMIDTSALLTRARMCADCHVGSRDREVNHDLIAAGHPALRFEMTQHHNRLPKHWRSDDPMASDPEWQRQLWMAGQIATAEAGLALLEARSDAQRVASVWPEFSEYNCAGCHHDLRLQSARRGRGSDSLIPVWGDWHYALLQQAATDAAEPVGEAWRESMAQLDAWLQDDMVGQQAAIHNTAGTARQQLHEWLVRQELPLDRAPARSSIHAFASSDQATASWETATQTFLALLAAEAGHVSAADEDAMPLLIRLRDELQFPDGRDGPLFLESLHPDQPLPADRFRTTLDQLLEHWRD